MEVMRSERLLFRTWDPADEELAFSLWGDSQVMALLTNGGLSREQSAARLRAEIAMQEELGLQYWVLLLKEGNAFVGSSGLRPWLHSDRGGYEFGFHLIPAAWGKGFAQEAGRTVIGLAQIRGLSHLMAGHHPENQNSKHALLKLGFQYVEDIFYAPTGLMHPTYRLSLA